MALCIAYLCISSFSASFCKRNIIKIIMKIRFCELSSLGAPVFMALLVPSGLRLGSSRGLDPAETLGLSQSTGWARGDPRWSTGGSQQSTVGSTRPKPSMEARAPQLLQEQDPLLPTQTPEQFPVFWDSLSFEVASPTLHSRWKTCPARAQQLLHSRSEAELDPAEPRPLHRPH